VALGLGLITVRFDHNTLFFASMRRGTGELFAVEPTAPGRGCVVAIHAGQYDAIRRETAVFADAFAMLRAVRTRIEDRR
jgi:hypothetical protein